ncbi:MAG: hypothetical protein OEL76_00540 [Siculibacillus sp.]|nr:hypothetical protein [Siculibacillus sp.]
MSIRSPRTLVIAAAAVAVLATVPSPIVADEGDPAGWSVATDPRGRAFLKWVPEAGGPRILLIGCLRDVDEFFVSSVGVGGLPERASGVGLVLTVADADHVVYGDIEPDPDGGGPKFMHEADFDAAARKRMAKQLLPVLKAPGPIVLQVENGEPVELPLEPIPPRAGIEEPLKRFEKVCFGRK